MTTYRVNRNNRASHHSCCRIPKFGERVEEALKELEVQATLTLGNFRADAPDLVWDAFAPYAEDPRFKFYLADVRVKLGLDEPLPEPSPAGA